MSIIREMHNENKWQEKSKKEKRKFKQGKTNI